MPRKAPCLVGVQTLKEIDGLLEIIDDLFLWSIIRVAGWIQSVDARSMLIPFVLPE